MNSGVGAAIQSDGALMCDGLNLRVRIVAGRLRSYLDPKFDCQPLPYFARSLSKNQRTSWGGWRVVGVWVLPLLEQILGLAKQSLLRPLVYVRPILAEVQPTLCCLGSLMCLLASNSSRMYRACPLQRYLWTDQSRDSFNARL